MVLLVNDPRAKTDDRDVYVSESAKATDFCVFDSGNEIYFYFYACAFSYHFQACLEEVKIN